jgi:hypothetical protein
VRRRLTRRRPKPLALPQRDRDSRGRSLTPSANQTPPQRDYRFVARRGLSPLAATFVGPTAEEQSAFGLALSMPHSRLVAGADCECMDDDRRSGQPRRPKIEEVSTEQAWSFAILRRPWCDGDLLPGSGEMFARGGLGRLGLNPMLARRATTQVGDVWVVPGNGHVAIVAGGATCAPTEIVAREGLMMWGSSAEMRPNVVARGLVPDGVAEVTLFGAGEPLRFLQPGARPRFVPVTLSVTKNVYGVVLPGEFLSGRFSGPAGTIEFGPWAR